LGINQKIPFIEIDKYIQYHIKQQSIKHKNIHKIYTTPKRQEYNKQIHIKNLKTKSKRTTNQQDITLLKDNH
jgi:hypothetical protein